MSDLPARSAPTHMLTVEVPLNLEDRHEHGYDAVKDAISLALAISRAGFAGAICDNANVTLRSSREVADSVSAQQARLVRPKASNPQPEPAR
jgi:hypothetical protein